MDFKKHNLTQVFILLTLLISLLSNPVSFAETPKGDDGDPGQETSSVVLMECETDTDGDGVSDCDDGCPEDPRNQVEPREGCFVNNSDIPSRYDPKVKVPEDHIATPETRPLPPYILNTVGGGRNFKIYYERFAGASFEKKALEGLAVRRKIPTKYHSRIISRNKKSSFRTSGVPLNAKTGIKFRVRIRVSYRARIFIRVARREFIKIQYRIVIKKGKKIAYSRWSKAVPVNRYTMRSRGK